DHVEVRDKVSLFEFHKPSRIQFVIAKAFSSAVVSSVPEPADLTVSHIVQFISGTVVDEKESDAALFLKLLHKVHLMFVNILERKCIDFAFLGIEADRNALDSPDIIDSTDLVKISQSNMPVLLIDLYR